MQSIKTSTHRFQGSLTWTKAKSATSAHSARSGFHWLSMATPSHSPKKSEATTWRVRTASAMARSGGRSEPQPGSAAASGISPLARPGRTAG